MTKVTVVEIQGCMASSAAITHDVMATANQISGAAKRALPFNVTTATLRNPSPSRSIKTPNLASQMRVAFARMAWKTGPSAPAKELITCNTSDVAVCCSRASLSSRVSRATSASLIGTDDDAVLDASRRFGFAALRRRVFAGLPLTLERRFIGSPVGSESILTGLTSVSEVAVSTPKDSGHLTDHSERWADTLSGCPNVKEPKHDNTCN